MFMVVDLQAFYSRDENVKAEVAEAYYTMNCVNQSNLPDLECSTENLKKVIAEDGMTWAELAVEITFMYRSMKGPRKPPMSAGHLDAWTLVQRLAWKACSSVSYPQMPPRLMNSAEAQQWGRDVHKEFERLIQAARTANPKLFGETGYYDSGKSIVPGPSKVKGHRYPDAVWAVAIDKPEVSST